MGARKNAFTLLVEMGHAFLRFGSNQEGEAWVMLARGGSLLVVGRVSFPQNPCQRKQMEKAPCPALFQAGCPLSLGALSSCDSFWFLPPEALQRYLILIYPGLVGPVTMVSCSILALTHLLFEFKGKYLLP